ncbi:hypothetical protein V8F63_15685 [Brevundimonas sp. LF-1]|uniref:hypothetical protein n=1 Tax=Brevundimonas sp. LF-1 TaxID=3126100 RepID=UPI0030E4A8E0
MTADPAPPPHAVDRPDVPPTGQDRGVSPIAGRLGGRQGRMITLAALAAGCGVFLFATWDRGDARDRKPPAADQPARQGAPFEPARRREPPPPIGDAGDPHAAPLTGEAEVLPAIEPSHDRTSPSTSPADERRALAESARRAPLLAYSRSGRASPAPGPASPCR